MESSWPDENSKKLLRPPHLDLVDQPGSPARRPAVDAEAQVPNRRDERQQTWETMGNHGKPWETIGKWVKTIEKL